MGPQPSERHQPLPGVLGLPVFLYRKLSPRGRRRFKIGAGLAAVAGVTLAIVLVPRIQGAKEEDAARERREAAQSLADRRRRLIEQQRPRTGKSARPGAAALKAALPPAIKADAERRTQTGELQNAPKRVECQALDAVRRAGRSLLSYTCTAVTSDVQATGASEGGTIGYPYRALADPGAGSFTYCRVAGQPGEGSYTREALASLPRACG